MVFFCCRGCCRRCQWHRSLRPDPHLARLADVAILWLCRRNSEWRVSVPIRQKSGKGCIASRALNRYYKGRRENRVFSCDMRPLTDDEDRLSESSADTGHSTADGEYEEPRVHRRMRFQPRATHCERGDTDNILYHCGAAAVVPGNELPATTEKEQQVRWMLRIFEAVTISQGYVEDDRPRWDKGVVCCHHGGCVSQGVPDSDRPAAADGKTSIKQNPIVTTAYCLEAG